MKLVDRFGRVHDYVRISLIDKCNLNCVYCNPVNSLVKFASNKMILSYEEIYRLVKVLVVNLEVKKIRFTGGEPLIRKEVLRLFEMVGQLKQTYNFQIGITTNGTALADKLVELRAYGVTHLNISLDTLKPSKFAAITGKDCFGNTLHAIQKAVEMDFPCVKLNVVVMRGINDDELTDFIEFFKPFRLSIRFIEYMPFSGNGWNPSRFLSWTEMKAKLEEKYALLELPDGDRISKNYLLAGTQLRIGFISPISHHFCYQCNRLRITSTGHIKTCLFSPPTPISIKPLLSDPSVEDSEIATCIQNALTHKWLKHPEVDELVKLDNSMVSIGG